MARNVKTATGGSECAMKFVTGIFHIILLKYCLQATLIKRTVVCYKRQAFYFLCHLRPHFRECRLSVSIPTGESVDLSSPPSRTITMPTLHTLERRPLAVSKSIATKSCIVSHSYTVHTSLKSSPSLICAKKPD